MDRGLGDRERHGKNSCRTCLRKGKAFCTGGDVKEMMAGNGFYQSEQMDLRSSLDLISSHMGIVTELPNHKERVQALIY